MTRRRSTSSLPLFDAAQGRASPSTAARGEGAPTHMSTRENASPFEQSYLHDAVRAHMALDSEGYRVFPPGWDRERFVRAHCIAAMIKDGLKPDDKTVHRLAQRLKSWCLPESGYKIRAPETPRRSAAKAQRSLPLDADALADEEAENKTTKKLRFVQAMEGLKHEQTCLRLLVTHVFGLLQVDVSEVELPPPPPSGPRRRSRALNGAGAERH